MRLRLNPAALGPPDQLDSVDYVPLVGPNYSITANIGKQVGSNLFHSFGQFGLVTGESAAFSGPATISNVIGRVTGGMRFRSMGKFSPTLPAQTST